MSTVEIGGQVYEHRTLLQTLESIKRLLRKHWTQGRYGNRLFLGEGFCLVGARLAIDGPHERKVKQLFQQVVPASFRTVEEYNDHHGRTKNQLWDRHFS